MSSVKGPGKLAPTLIEDLHLHEPGRPLANGLNLLRDTPLFYSGYSNVATLLPSNNCRHSWHTKHNQTVLPALDARPQFNSAYKFAGICRNCRVHVELVITYTAGWESQSCPNSAYPLHHFVHSPWRERSAEDEKMLGGGNGLLETYAFDCSSPKCSASLLIRTRLPILPAEHVRALTDRGLLSQRAEEVIGSQPTRFEGHRKPYPVDVLSDLRMILGNIFEDGESRTIKADNKRFSLRFGIQGQPCKDVLEFLGFKYERGEHWVPPEANHDDFAPFGDAANIFLDDMILELSVLVSRLPEGDRHHIQDTIHLEDAGPSLLRTLGAHNYNKHTSSRSMAIKPEAREICYAALGAPQDASDELVSFAYQAQKRTNSREAPMYLSYLRQIAENRRSEYLETLAAKEYSTGNLDAGQVTDAYRYFSLSPQDSAISDDLVLGTFRATLQDSAMHEPEMRAHLRVIGEHRHSKQITDAAEDVLDTCEQALAFFDAEPTVADEFIPTLYTTKTTEDATIRQKARKAVELIAETRSSAALYSWLQTGELGETTMDIGEAYRLLGIPDRTVDETMIESAYKVAMEDNPHQSETYAKAFNAIVVDRQSSQLQPTSRGTQSSLDLGRPDWPVGLENIGNTCYLNSLLQFLFTVPDLRNLVLNFEDVRMEMTPENIARKKVGSRQIVAREIERAQRFVLKLRELFLEMISSPYQHVAPDQELTRLTLMTSTAAENIRRRSTIGGPRPLGTMNGLPMQGPLGPWLSEDDSESKDDVRPSPFEDILAAGAPSTGLDHLGELNSSETAAAIRSSGMAKDGSGDNSSEVTLVSTASVDDSVMVDSAARMQYQGAPDDMEQASLAIPTGDYSSDAVMSQQSGTSSSTLAAEDHAAQVVDDVPLDDPAGPSASTAGQTSARPPNRPPPQPPRPTAASQSDPTLEEYARQQDVTEVLNHVLFQLSCAIKPIAFDDGGEQMDQIKELFYGRTKQHIMSEDEEEAKNDTFCSIIVRLFSLPYDIYAALDGYFDVEEIANKRRFLSISRLPPIFQIQIDRASLAQRKNNHHVELKETIYLDRYLEEGTNPALMQRRQEAWAWKRELAELEARRLELTANESHPDAQTILDHARAALMHLQELSTTVDGVEVPTSAIATLELLAEQTQAELQGLTSRCKDLSTNINSQFADSAFCRHAYRLHAAFFHHGSASSGHYWIYIYDFRKEKWLKYNDTRVEEVRDTNEIFRRPSEAEFSQWNGPSNPYYLVYVRDEDKHNLVESVCRKMRLPPTPQEDVEMKDAIERVPEMMQASTVASDERSATVPLALRERSDSNGEWNDAQANSKVQW